MLNIYKHSHFLPNQFGHGGEKRTAQISEIVSKAGIPFTEADFSAYAPSTKSVLHYLRGVVYSKNIIIGLKSNYAIGRYLKQFEDFVADTRPDFFIWESTVEYNLLLAEVLHKHRVPFVAIPHNIESLVKGATSRLSKKKSFSWLTEELGYLKYADHIFAISKEEQWLLSVYGINASYLPYYPPEELKTSLLATRSERGKRPQIQQPVKQILLLGTFYNKPTYNGYVEIINQVKKYPSIQIQVAGLGSEQLKGTFNRDNIKIWGSVSNQELNHLLINCDYALVHQEPSSGALTRIPELLLAGLPVIANNSASRSYHGQQGIYTYHNYTELADFINSELPVPPAPDRPAGEKYFIDYLKSAIGHL